MIPDAALIGYFAAYALVLATPGPNMLMVGALASLKGFGAVLPLALGLGVGGVALGAMIYGLAGLVPAGTGWHMGERLLSGVVMLWLGWRLLGAAPMAEATQPAGLQEQGADFAMGVTTAVSNPVTLAFFVSQLVGPLSDCGLALMGPLLLATAALGVLKALSVAVVFSQPLFRRQALRWFQPARTAIALLFFGLAALKLAPLIAPPAPPS